MRKIEIIPPGQTLSHTRPGAEDWHPETNPAASYLLSLPSRHSRRTMRSLLNQAARRFGAPDLERCPWTDMRRSHVDLLLGLLDQDGKTPATLNSYLAALKGVARAAMMMGQLDPLEYERIKAVKPRRGSRTAKGRMLQTSEIEAAIGAMAATEGPQKARNLALFAVLLSGGLRRTEASSLNWEQIDWQDGSLKVLGKGNKERIVYLPEKAMAYLKIWIEDVRGAYPG
ncbi:site-specific integrase, partial [Roseibium sp. RKSG952]|uniref:tyrosine-type recombinase/integrase n=1 Tax=Roseibium sp. RKSG952 TaxID=2529384 RepID=UPI0012BC4BFC